MLLRVEHGPWELQVDRQRTHCRFEVLTLEAQTELHWHFPVLQEEHQGDSALEELQCC